MNVKSLSVVAAALMSAAAGAGEKEFDSVRIVLRDGTAVMTAAGAGEKATLAANPAAATRDFADEVWMSVGCGTDLQEYYITTSMMHPGWWDILADGIKWLKANQDVLVDSHWIGGDPQAPSGAEVYGYAAWAPKDGGSKGIVLLRNPSADGQEFTATLAELLELVGAPAKAKVVDAKTVYSHDVTFKVPKTAADKVEFAFDPFGLVLVEFAFGK